MSVDILDWEPMVFDAMVGFGSRIDNFTALHGYWPRLRILAHEEGRFWNGAFVGGGWQAVDTTSFVLGPSRPLRLTYTLAGSEHTTAIFDLAKPGEPISISRGTDSSYTEGRFCVWFNRGSSATPFKVTLDNIIMTWTQP
jgi:hypothetical protein